MIVSNQFFIKNMTCTYKEELLSDQTNGVVEMIYSFSTIQSSEIFLIPSANFCLLHIQEDNSSSFQMLPPASACRTLHLPPLSKGTMIQFSPFNDISAIVKWIQSHLVARDSIETVLQKIKSFSSDIHQSVLAPAILTMIQNKGVCKIAQLAECYQYTHQHFGRLFRKSLGITPKQFCDMIKLHIILSFLQRENTFNIAYDLGIYDQSHLNKLIQRYTNSTPLQLQRLIQETDEIEYFVYTKGAKKYPKGLQNL